MSLLKGVALAVAAWQGKVIADEAMEKTRLYNLGEALARQMGKPFLVVGGPYGTAGWRKLFNVKAHPCGDLCLDINASACTGCPTLQADVREIPLPSGFAGVALASHVLEHLPTVQDAMQAVWELRRVADHVLVAYPRKLNIIAQLHPDHHLWVWQEGDGSIMIQQRRR